jgi:aminomethyltransferase
MDAHSEREYYAFRNTAGLIDVSPLHKYDITGPDAAVFLAWIWTRDIERIGVGRVVYGCMCDDDGNILDDGTVSRITSDLYRMTSSEAWMGWLQQQSRGLQVTITDVTDTVCALALQGPLSRRILKPLVAFDVDKMRFFRVRKTTLAGMNIALSRTGYTGDLGFEIWADPSDALALWDVLAEEGAVHGMEPVGLDALDVVRIEAGFVLQGVDYISASRCMIPRRMSTPEEAGLGRTVDLERAPFIGQAALREEASRGPAWDLVGLELDWAELDALYGVYGLPPHLAPIACRTAVPVCDAHGKQIGQVTSTTWSPILKKMIALATVRRPFHKVGTALQVEHTVEFERRWVTARVVQRPFFDPPRKRLTPGRVAKESRS